MDHLPVPLTKQAHSPIVIPYLCNDHFAYDDEGLLTYPHRANVDVHQLLISEQRTIHPDTLAAFLQEWLWFGLLGEILLIGSGDRVPQRVMGRESFVCEGKDGKRVLRTSGLREYTELSAKDQAPLFSGFKRARFQKCLAKSTEIINACISSRYGDETLSYMKESGEFPTLYRVLLSIQVLGESLSAYQDILSPAHRFQRFGGASTTMQSRTDLVDALLQQAGWCPNEIRRMPSDIPLRYYLSFFDRSQLAQEHGKCIRDRCIKDQHEEEEDSTKQPIHSCNNCSCQEVIVSEDKLSKIIQDGDVPLLTFGPSSSGGQRQLEISRITLADLKSAAREYVAISHVRCRGLGNSQLNSLPYCQLSSLQAYVDDLYAHYLSDPNHQSIAFWIDTLCIPIVSNFRKRALRNIHSIYSHASKVLVLDPSLFNHLGSSLQECLFRIKYSSWMRRLWTLQEGTLAKLLYFQFSNRTWRLDKLLENLDKITEYPFIRQRVPSVDMQRLSVSLALFDNDIKVVDESLDNTCGEYKRPYDKHKLRSNLRLGYIISYKFWYFAEEGERAQAKLIMEALFRLYPVASQGIEDGYDIVSGEDGGAPKGIGLGLQERKRRLREIEGLNLVIEEQGEAN